MGANKHKENFLNIKGQMSVWDLPPVESTKSPTSIKNITKPVEGPAGINHFIKDTNEISVEQQSLVDFYKSSDRTNRIIKYCYGYIGVELIHGDSFQTTYVNSKGSKIFVTDKKSSALPMDTILYYKNSNPNVTDIQEERLRDFIAHKDFKRVIKRNGDENLLIESDGKIIDILPNGWILEFERVSSISCSEDEVYMLPKKEDINIGQKVHVDDVVRAYYGKKIIEGPIVREYGIGNSILNINFELDGVKYQTAIGRFAVIEILSSSKKVDPNLNKMEAIV